MRKGFPVTVRFVVLDAQSGQLAADTIEQLAEAAPGSEVVAALEGATVGDALADRDTVLAAQIARIRDAAGDVVLIAPADGGGNPAFDAFGWNLDVAASSRAGIVYVPETDGSSAELIAQEVAAAQARAAARQASIVAVAVPQAWAGQVNIDGIVTVATPATAEGAAALTALPAPTAVTPLAFQSDLIARAAGDRKRIVLPEPDDDRVLQAAAEVVAKGIADVIFVGEEETVRARAAELGLDLAAARVVSVDDPELAPKYAEEYARLRAKKGITLEQAAETIKDVSYFGTMMVHMEDADGMVSGAAHTTAHTIVPSFQIIKTKPGTSIVSSIFLMLMKDRVWAFGDCAVNPNPTPEQLGDIAISSAETAAAFGLEPKVAMLSYSTGTSGSGPDVDAVVEATTSAKAKAPELALEGPIQFDAAVDQAVASKKLPDSPVAGHANVFVFPDLDAGNIGYKAVQRSSGAIAVGPVLQGLNKPVNDLSRGALVEDIVNTIAITAIQAQG